MADQKTYCKEVRFVLGVESIEAFFMIEEGHGTRLCKWQWHYKSFPRPVQVQDIFGMIQASGEIPTQWPVKEPLS